MTATFDALTDMTQNAPKRKMMRGVRRVMMRSAKTITGMTLIISGMALWVAPTTIVDGELVLMKLGLSLFLGFAGLAIMQTGYSKPEPEIEIDTIRREVRLVRGYGRQRRVLGRTSIRDLGKAQLCDDVVRLHTATGTLLAEVPLDDAEMRTSLCNALHDAGKL